MTGRDATSRLTGRVVLVTGAARGIGRAVAEAATGAGATVIAVDVLADVRTLGEHAVVADAASVADMERVVQRADDAGLRIDAVVANAGLAAPTSANMSLDVAVDTFDRMIDGNLRSAYVTVRAAFEHLLAGDPARPRDLVLVSTDHVAPRPGSVPKVGMMEAYDAAKWGLEGLRRNWASTLGRAGVRVNTVAMGETDTPMLREFLVSRGVEPAAIDEMASGWLPASGVAGVVIDLLAEEPPGRTDTTIGLWPGHPVGLPPISSPSAATA